MPISRSAALAMWARAWLAGHAAFDDVIDAVTGTGAPHEVRGLASVEAAHQGGGPGAGQQFRPDRGSSDSGGADVSWSDSGRSDSGRSDSGRSDSGWSDRAAPDPRAAGRSHLTPQRLGAALIAWRAAGADVRLVLPVPGDVRGVPGPRSFLDAALSAGEAVFGGGLGLVPTAPPMPPSMPPPAKFPPAMSPRHPSTGHATAPPVVWRAFVVAAAPPDVLQLAEAEHELAAAMRETATLFSRAGLGGGAVPAADLARARRASDDLLIPPGLPQRAAAMLAQAERLEAVLAVAARDPQGGGTDRHAITLRADALRRLGTTVRRARLAGYNAADENPDRAADRDRAADPAADEKGTGGDTGRA